MEDEHIKRFLERLSTEDAVKIKAGLEQQEKDIALIEQGLLDCYHPRIEGDNYGESCGICREQLKGYGYRGTEKTCIHAWIPNYEHKDLQHCRYCQTTQRKPQAISDRVGEVGPS